MINEAIIKRAFVERLGWEEVGDLPGQFSVSPDKEIFKRVFSSDVKTRKSGHKLLGVIGIYYPIKDEFKANLGLLAYITNFDMFYDPPLLGTTEALFCWVDLIAEGVLSLPNNPASLRDSIGKGRLGIFELDAFLQSTPWGQEFIKKCDHLSE